MQNNQGLVYKGHPLRRVGNIIYYGTMAEPPAIENTRRRINM